MLLFVCLFTILIYYLATTYKYFKLEHLRNSLDEPFLLKLD